MTLQRFFHAFARIYFSRLTIIARQIRGHHVKNEHLENHSYIVSIFSKKTNSS